MRREAPENNLSPVSRLLTPEPCSALDMLRKILIFIFQTIRVVFELLLIGAGFISFLTGVLPVLGIGILFDEALVSVAVGVSVVAYFALTRGKRKKRVLVAYAGFVVVLLSAFGIHEYLVYKDSLIVVVKNEIDFGKYEPFSESVPRLPQAPTLKIRNDIPVLDGALALYPLYAAYATALYPERDYRVALRNSDRSESFYAFYDGSIDSGHGNGKGGKNQGDRGPHQVHFTNTITGFKGLLDGRVDIFFMAEISEEQKKMAEEKGVKLKYTPLGKEAFVFFVNAKNPVDDLSLEQIRGIYSGKITRWDGLGGHGAIRAFQRNENSGSQSALLRIMGRIPLTEAPTVERNLSMGGIIRDVADYKNHENSIGFSFRYFTNVMVRNDQIKLLKIDGVAPTVENVRNGSYPLAAPYYAITREDTKNPNVPKMLKWFVSEQGQVLTRKVMEN
ncbi:MAG: substrate-binding domain-containing protein [Candidatus Accumulibacter sp.]|jgi:phosphate transport system substrate-binding protein|nr:substrate-binding domain-containing protein [Accumulibacter sp.]